MPSSFIKASAAVTLLLAFVDVDAIQKVDVQQRRSDGISTSSGGLLETASGGFAWIKSKESKRKVSLIQGGTQQADNTTVWIAGWPRSGSTTMFEMVLSAALEEHNITVPANATGESFLRHKQVNAAKSHFGLFEPCHWGLGNTTPDDRFTARDLTGHCDRVMDRLVNCNFTGIEFLFGWSGYSGPHTDISNINPKRNKYNPNLAQRSCSKSNLLVYKTVNEFGRSVDQMLPILESHPGLLALVPVRDPRGIYASWKKRPWGVDGPDFLVSICKQHKANIDQRHPRLQRVVFEKLAKHPEKTMRDVFTFLGLDFGTPQLEWVKKMFNSDCAAAGKKSGGAFDTCHTDSTEPIMRWRQELNEQEKEIFRSNPDCQAVAKEYGYEL